MNEDKAKAQNINLQDVEKLLNQQTTVILDAVDEKLAVLDKKIDVLDKRMDGLDKRMDIIEKRFDKFEERINKKIDKLITLVDKFVNLYTKQEQEFKIMKYEINKIKEIIKEKLGVEVS